MTDTVGPLRRGARPAATLLAAGLLSGCAGSGVYSYWGDTFRLPFHDNPNITPAPSTGYADETYAKIRGGKNDEPKPMLYEAGDVWPPAPKAPPTLKDLQNQQAKEISNNGSGGQNYAPLQPLPQLPGYEVPEQQTHAAPPTTTFPGGVVNLPNGRHGVLTGGGGEVKSLNGPTGNGSIVVPNGNGTSTVIGPSGTVSTIPTPGK